MLIAVLATAHGTAAQTSDFNRPALVVRSYTDRVSADDMREANRTATAIVRRAGIEVLWLDCSLPDAVETPERCRLSLAWNEVVLRVMPAGAADIQRDAEGLGFAFVDVETRRGSMATVYSDLQVADEAAHGE